MLTRSRARKKRSSSEPVRRAAVSPCLFERQKRTCFISFCACFCYLWLSALILHIILACIVHYSNCFCTIFRLQFKLGSPQKGGPLKFWTSLPMRPPRLCSYQTTCMAVDLQQSLQMINISRLYCMQKDRVLLLLDLLLICWERAQRIQSNRWPNTNVLLMKPTRILSECAYLCICLLYFIFW